MSLVSTFLAITFLFILHFESVDHIKEFGTYINYFNLVDIYKKY